MKILLTGGTGFVGRHLVRSLGVAGHIVYLLIRPESNIDLLPTNIGFSRCNNSYESISAAFSEFDPDLVIHLATNYVARHTPSDVLPLLESNVTFGTILLEAMSKTRCRMIINAGTRWQHCDNSPYKAANLYAASKQAFLEVLEYYSQYYLFKTLTLELCDTYGPGDQRKKVVELMTDTVAMNQPLPMSPGQQILDVLHVEEVVDAFIYSISILEKNIPGICMNYTLSSLSPQSLRVIGTKIETYAGRTGLLQWGAIPYRSNEVMKPLRYFPNIPEWRPRVDLDIRLKQYVGSRI
jgi:nucleoside-diphosphate-sugar epimerase